MEKPLVGEKHCTQKQKLDYFGVVGPGFLNQVPTLRLRVEDRGIWGLCSTAEGRDS